MQNPMIDISKAYESKLVEKRIYKFWLDNGFFTAKIDSSKKPFTIIMHPPNVTGELHMGHALTFTIQDILIRYHRMKGKEVLWQAGTDHAGIATQMVVERQLRKNNIERKVLGRKKFIEKVWQWKKESGSKISNQLRRLGASADWSRERFTMDDGLSKAVKKVFVDLYKDKFDPVFAGEKPPMPSVVGIDTGGTSVSYTHLTLPTNREV